MAAVNCNPALTSAQLEHWANNYHREIRKRAKRRGLSFEITKTDLVDLVRRADGACSLTGISFSEENPGGHFRRPWMPSVDRIDSSIGYVISNCRIVCSSVNHALGEWGEPVLMQIAAHLSSRLAWGSSAHRTTGLPKNVSWMEDRQVYRVRIRANGKDRHVGCYPTVETAEAAAKRARVELGLGL